MTRGRKLLNYDATRHVVSVDGKQLKRRVDDELKRSRRGTQIAQPSRDAQLEAIWLAAKKSEFPDALHDRRVQGEIFNPIYGDLCVLADICAEPVFRAAADKLIILGLAAKDYHVRLNALVRDRRTTHEWIAVLRVHDKIAVGSKKTQAITEVAAETGVASASFEGAVKRLRILFRKCSKHPHRDAELARARRLLDRFPQWGGVAAKP